MPADPAALVTTGEWLDRWLGERTGPRASTIRGYAAHVRLYLRPCLGHILLADLTAQHVQATFTAIARQHEAESRPVTAATPAGGVDGGAGRRLGAHRDPAAGRGVDPAQTARFLNAIRGHRLYAAYHLIALRGLRRGEAAGLRWRDVDLDTATAIITSQLQQYDGRLVLYPPKTVGSERAVALDRTTVAVLCAHKAAQDAERGAAGKDYHDSGYVFTCLNGDPMARTGCHVPFAAWSVRSGCRRSGCTTCGTARPASRWPQRWTWRWCRTCSATPASC
jgi:integrase